MKYSVTVNGKTLEVSLHEKRGSTLRFSVDGKEYTTNVEHAPLARGSTSTTTFAPPIQQPSTTQPNVAAKPGQVVAPMPGIVTAIKVKAGDSVAAGTTVAVIEAMKMENNITSHHAGTVNEVFVQAGQEVSNNQILVSLT